MTYELFFSEEAEPEGNEPDEIIRGPATDRITIGQDKTGNVTEIN